LHSHLVWAKLLNHPSPCIAGDIYTATQEWIGIQTNPTPTIDQEPTGNY